MNKVEQAFENSAALIHLRITLGFSSSLIKVHRVIYSIGDWAAEVGGLIGALYLTITFTIAVIQGGNLEAYLISQLYQYRKGHE